MIRSLEDELKLANEKFDKEIELTPDLYKESGRPFFVHGWLQNAYDRLFKEMMELKLKKFTTK